MPLIFGNGGTPVGNNPYTGLTYTTASGLASLLKDILGKAGWGLNTSLPSPDFIMQARYSDSINKKDITFKISDINDIPLPKIQLLSLSVTADLELSIEFTVGHQNTIFITADKHAAAIANFPAGGTGEIMHFGYLDIIPQDKFEINTAFRTGQFVYIGKAFTILNNANIYPRTIGATQLSGYDSSFRNEGSGSHVIGDHFSGSNFYSSGSSIPIHTIQNINSGSRSMSSGNSPSTVTDTNTAYFGHIGGNDSRSNLPLIAPYYYLEGDDGNTGGNNYGNVLGSGICPTLKFSGTVPFLATGFSHLPAMSQWNTESGQVYITGDVPFQGMRIA